jgi:branched-chain amino acid transport system substrate-binding protein
MPHALLALVVLLALVTLQLQPTPAAEPYNINVIIPLTGAAGLGGQTTAKTIAAIEDIVNRTGGIRGVPVHFVIHDDTSNPQVAVQLLTQVMAEKPTVIEGSMLGATCQAMAPLVRTAGPVHYCFSPVVYPPSGSFTFTGSPATASYVTAFYRYFLARGIKSFAMISSTDASGQDADTQFERGLTLPEFKDSGLTMVAHEHFNITDLSVAAQMTRIKAANPQALLGYAAGSPFGTVLRGINESGLAIPIFATSSAQVLALLKQFPVEVMPHELYFPGFGVLAGVWRSPAAKAEQDRFLAVVHANNIPLDALATAPWDPTFIIIEALRAVGPTATADQLRAYLETMHGHIGLWGDYDFRDGSQRGLGPNAIVVERYDPVKQDFIAVSGFGGRGIRR